jgi:hypothetical protein
MKIESPISLFSTRPKPVSTGKPIQARPSLDKPIGWFFDSTPAEIAGETFRRKKLASKAQNALFIMTEQGPVAYRLPKASSAYEWVHRVHYKALVVTTPEGRVAYQPKNYRLVRTHDFITGKPVPEAAEQLEKACYIYFQSKPGSTENKMLTRFLLEPARPGEPFALFGAQHATLANATSGVAPAAQPPVA